MLSIAAATGVTREEITWWNLERYPSLRTSPMTIGVGWVLATEGDPLPTPNPTPVRQVAQPSPLPAGGSSAGRGEGTGQGEVPPQRGTPTPDEGSWTAATYQILVGFLDGAELAYGQASSAMMELAYYPACVGRSPAECDALKEEGSIIMAGSLDTLTTHLSYMQSHPAHPCFADAYTASHQLADRYIAWLQNWQPGGIDTPQGRDQLQAASSISDATSTFYATDYYSDCG